jgi:hypothetical protein
VITGHGVQCPLCGRTKPTEDALRDHVGNVHPDDHCRLYHVQPCRADAALSEYLNHWTAHTDSPPPASDDTLRISLDPAGPGGVVYPRQAGKRMISDETRGIMQRMGINADEALARAAGGASALQRIINQAADARLRAAQRALVCPLHNGGDRLGCRDVADCDQHGGCRMAETLARQEAYERQADLSPSGRTVSEIIDEMIQSSERSPNEIVVESGYPNPNSAHEDAQRAASHAHGACPQCRHPRHDIRPFCYVADGHDEQDRCMCRHPLVSDWCPIPGNHVHESDHADPEPLAVCPDCGHPAHQNTCGQAVGVTYSWTGEETESCACTQWPYGLGTAAGDPLHVPTADEILNDWPRHTGQVIGEHDPDFNDLQTYLEGGTLESNEAAKRLDQRGVDAGQISPKTYWDTWNEMPKPAYDSHKIWCARWRTHRPEDCPVWGAE